MAASLFASASAPTVAPGRPPGQPQTLDGALSDEALLAHERALRHLGDRGFVQFHPALAERLGHKAALFLGLALYWTRHTLQNQPHRKGWFYMTAKQWSQSTGLSNREQTTARATLTAEGLLQEALTGRPAVMHYRIDLAKLAQWLGVVDVASGRDVTNWEPLSGWFRNYICFYKPLADLTGNVACGLYLSFLLQIQRKALLEQQLRAGAIHVSQDEVSIALCLGPKVQRNARERLRLAGLLREAGSSLVQLNLPAIMACLLAQDGRALPQSRKKSPPQSQTPVLALVGAPDDSNQPNQPATPDSHSGQTGAAPPSDAVVAPTQWANTQLQLGLLALAGTAAQPAGSPPATAATRSLLRMSLTGIQSRMGSDPAQHASRFEVAGITQLANTAARQLAGEAVAENAKLDSSESAESAKLDSSRNAESAKLKMPKTHAHISIGISNTTTTRARGTVDNSPKAASPRRRRPSLKVCKPESVDSKTDPEQLEAEQRLVFPSNLDADFIPGIRSVLAKAAPAERQALLDELGGQLGIQGKTIHNPAGWLLGLIRQVQGGEVVLAMAGKVAADRQHRLSVERQVQRANQGAARLPVKTQEAPAADPAIVEAARQKLRLLRAELVGKRSSK